MDNRETIDFVVGEEKRLSEVIREEEIMPLLQAAVQAGVERAEIVDDSGTPLWSCGEQPKSLWAELQSSGNAEAKVLYLEGEPVGELRLSGSGIDPNVLEASTSIICGALNAILTGNLKRMLTTEIHTQVVNQSYEELLATNQQLSLSEKKYRDLAENLEIRVQQRTDELKRLYTQMVNQEKMASIGQMAAGIAHEINNPLGFILSNLNAMKRYFVRYQEMIDSHREGLLEAGSLELLRESSDDLYKKLKLDFVKEDMQDLFAESIHGAERVKKIVADLKGFSHIDALGDEKIDINQEIERTLSVMAHEIPKNTNIIKRFETLPELSCLGGLLAQVLFNLLRNAFQSRSEGLEVTIETSFAEHVFVVKIEDNGSGIDSTIRPRIFEPFFTTREVGSGTGLGLSVVYDILSNWGGQVDVDESPSGGASFVVQIPEKITHG